MFLNLDWLGIISRQYIFGLRYWNHALINHWIILFKSSNSQHGWILLWLSVTNIMIEVFKVFSAMAIILSMDMTYFTIEGIVPSCCRLTIRHLGAILLKLRLHQICKSHVAASMHHDTWGLMQSHFCSPYWRPDSSHCNEPALGGYQLLLSTIKVHKFSSIILKDPLLSW